MRALLSKDNADNVRSESQRRSTTPSRALFIFQSVILPLASNFMLHRIHTFKSSQATTMTTVAHDRTLKAKISEMLSRINTDLQAIQEHCKRIEESEDAQELLSMLLRASDLLCLQTVEKPEDLKRVDDALTKIGVLIRVGNSFSHHQTLKDLPPSLPAR
jgi:biotin synthase-related radical SAM superfamily protein